MPIPTLTEAAAAQKLCPLTCSPHQSNCCASQCMGWQWMKPACVQEKRYIKLGYGVDRPETEPAVETLCQQPKGAGWQLSKEEPIYFYDGRDDGEESAWVIHWEREADPERQGYCAMMPHPAAIREALDEFTTTIYGVILEGQRE